jgi:polyhydroxybutyrate depolymerase
MTRAPPVRTSLERSAYRSLTLSRHNPTMRSWNQAAAKPAMRQAACAVAVLLAQFGVAACRRAAPPTDEASGTTTHTLTAGGEQREYRLYVPPGVSAPAPLVLMLHGGFGTAEHAQEHYGWDDAARAHGFVVAYPDGLGRAWNAGGSCCGEPGRTGVDDVAFLTAVVAEVGTIVPIDADRVFATGMSNGALMSYRLACDTPLFAAIAPVAGTMLGDCPEPAPISVLHIHGLADQNVRYDGAPGAGVAGIDGPDVPSLLET